MASSGGTKLSPPASPLEAHGRFSRGKAATAAALFWGRLLGPAI